MTKPILLSILTALAVFAVLLGAVRTTTSAAFLGFPSFKDSTAATATDITVATIGSQIGVHVFDEDLIGQSTNVTVRSTSDTTGFTLGLNQVAAGRYSALLEIATVSNLASVPPTLKAALGDTVTALYPDPLGLTTSYTITVVSQTDAELQLAKLGSPNPVITGADLTYTLTLKNNGLADATNVTLTDELPAEVSFASATASQGSCGEASRIVTCNTVSLAAGATMTVTIVVSIPIDAEDGSIITNVATATASENDPNPDNNTNITTTTTVLRVAVIQLTKTASPEPVLVGEPLTYTLTATNEGPSDATEVTVTDFLPPGVVLDTISSSQGGCQEIRGNVTCLLGDLARNFSASVAIVVIPPPELDGQTIINSASVTVAEVSPRTSVSVESTVGRRADLSVVKSASLGSVTVGEELSYKITVTNAGPDPAPSVTLDDPVGVSIFVSATPSQGSCSEVSRVVICDLGTIASGAIATTTIVVIPFQPGNLSNTAGVSVLGGAEGATDPRPTNNIVTITTTVEDAGDGTISLKDGASASANELRFAFLGAQVGVHVHDDALAAATSTVVTLVSDSDPVGLSLTLNRLATSSFSAVFEIATSTQPSSSPPRLKAADGDAVIATYADLIDALLVDMTGPVFTNLAPADGTITGEETLVVSVSVTDWVSGVDRNSIRFLINTTGDDTATAFEFPPSALTTIPGGFRGREIVNLTGVNFVGAKASDNAGNQAIFDVDESDQDRTMAKITVDSDDPVMSQAFTGVWFDPTTKQLKFNDRKKLIVIFVDNLTKLDPTSIDPTDFLVLDHTVVAADWHNADIASSTVSGLEAVDIRLSVFLTVADGLGPDETPGVLLVPDGVRDEAGNVRNLGQVTAQDRIVLVCGDLNGDGLVNVFDAIIDLQIIVGLIEPTQAQMILGDVVRDGTINVFDAILLLQHIVGLTEITHCGPEPIAATNTSLAPQLPVPLGFDEGVLVSRS